MSETGQVRLTMLNSMAGTDFVESLDRQRAWGIRELDLKDRILGKRVQELSDREAGRVADLAAARNMSVYCMSAGLFGDDVEKGPDAFGKGGPADPAGVDRAIQIAKILRPRFVRLLSATSSKRDEFAHSPTYLDEAHPWLLAAYRDAIDKITDAGFEATLENEVGPNLLGGPQEILDLFSMLGRRGKVSFTWDVQNLWQVGGRLPSMDTYQALRPIIGFVHLKGGMAEPGSRTLAWKSSLEDASWPVAEIVRRVAADGVSPVLCLNPSHGQVKPGYDYDDIVERDIEFLRRQVPQIASARPNPAARGRDSPRGN